MASAAGLPAESSGVGKRQREDSYRSMAATASTAATGKGTAYRSLGAPTYASLGAMTGPAEDEEEAPRYTGLSAPASGAASGAPPPLQRQPNMFCHRP